MDEDLKKLPPKERLKKLKELEKKKKQEIEEAHKQLLETEEEITEQQKWVDKVPIPEVEGGLEGLGKDGKELLKTHHGVSESLEETLAGEQIPVTEEEQYAITPDQAAVMEYGHKSERPMGEIYQDALALKQDIENAGYISQDNERKLEYLSGVAEERMNSAKYGTYSMTEEVAQKASSIQSILSSSEQAVRASYAHREKMHGTEYKL